VNGSLPATLPLFPSDSGAVVSKAAMVGTIEALAGLCGEAAVDQAGRRRFGGHSLRVTGAQHLAGVGIPLTTILLLGRWASDAICRYVAEAPLHSLATDLRRGAGESCTERVVQDLQAQVAEVTKLFEALQQKAQEQAAKEAFSPPPLAQAAAASAASGPAYIINELRTERTIHRAWAGPEHLYSACHWRSPCGWQYGLARHSRTHTLPERARRLCRRCFRLEHLTGVLR